MNVNYKQLIFAREYRKLSQTELAAHIPGLSQPNLSKFEKGLGILSDEVLNRIIKFLNFPESFFEIQISNNVENAHYRRKASVTKTQKSAIEYSNKLIGYIIDEMSASLDYPRMTIKFVNVDDGYSPEKIAWFLRRFLGIQEGDPVRDIVTLLEKNGIFVVEIDEDVDVFDGVSFLTDNGYPVIVVNKNFSNDHKRRTIAHELGHIIMHLSKDFIFADDRNKEKEADRFANEFLMPECAIINSLRYLKLSSLVELKRYWLVSMTSIVRRAYDLKCIDKDKYTYFNRELGRKGYKKNEPIDVYIDHPSLFITAYRMHCNELEYSNEELANAFHLPQDVIERFCVPAKKYSLRIF